ncbi:MAG: hypothetical protein H7835_18450 [Magnetococcus sp. XQGC-1]
MKFFYKFKLINLTKGVYLKYLYFFIVILFLSIRLIGIKGDIVNTDAERWHRRSENFLEALKQNNFKETYQRYHPGVTLMWFNSIIKYLSFKYQLTYTSTPFTLENADYFINIHAISKAFNILIYLALFLVTLGLIRKLFNDKVTLIYGTLLSIEPYFVAINRWFHQTSFEVFFAFISFLAILVWYKETRYRYIILSSFALAFSVLAKVTSLILLPVLGFVFLHKIYTLYFCEPFNKSDVIKSIKFIMLQGFSFIFLLALFIFIFFPALWVDSLFVWNQMYGSIFNAVTDNIRSELITGLTYYLYYFVIFVFKLSPITFTTLVFALLKFRKSNNFNILMLILGIFNYFIFLTITEQKIDRYFLIFIPFVVLICSVYLSELSLSYLFNIFIFIILFTGFYLYKYYPVYSAYYSPLFGGTYNALAVGVYDNSGEYFTQAALYLNTLGRDKYTYVPNGFSSFNLLYKGNIQRDFTDETNYVVTSFDMTRSTIKDIQYENCNKLLKEFGPNNDISIVYVWECN